MEKYISVAINTRVIVCVITAIVSLLLIGAGQVTQELQTRKKTHNKEVEGWQKVGEEMVKHIPLEHKASWKKAVADNPEFFLKINTLQFVRYDRRTK